MKIGDKMSSQKISVSKYLHNTRLQKITIALFTFMVIFFICSKSIIPEKYNINEGEIAGFDIKAPRDFQDDMATQVEIDKALEGVPTQYTNNPDILSEAIDSIEKYFTLAMEIKKSDIDETAKIEKFKAEASLTKLVEDDYTNTLKLDETEMKILSEFLITNLSKILSQGITNDEEAIKKGLADIKKGQVDLDFYIRNDTNLTKSMKELATNIGITLIKPNLTMDEIHTEELKSQVSRDVERVIIKRNQNIVAKGEVITKTHIYQMTEAGLLHSNSKVDISIYSGVGALVILMEVLVTLFIYNFRKNIYNNNSKLLIIAIIICVNAIFAVGGNVISGYLVPAGFAVILMSIIFDPLLAFIITIPSAAIIACVTNFNIEAVIIYLIGAMSGILLSFNVNQRNNFFIGGGVIGLLNGILIFSMGLINNNNITQNLINSSIGLVGGILSAILAIGILPVFEQLFDIITPMKLLELSNPNQALLKKMLFEAPGTYHHSVLVGNLAEAAANEIGANAILTRTGAYYHDIGKIKRPYFFKENQITNDNPHDKITPKLSTLIITSHVKDGMELAEEYKLPGAIKDIIIQHHGTTLVKYFYVMAMNNENEEVEEASYRYEGPKPNTKESALVMLADSIEAAVRSISAPTSADIEKMLNKIIQDKVDDGQLNDSNLTLKDIEKTKQSFLKVLEGIFHSRIEYPELNNQIKEGMSTVDRI